MAPYSLVEGHLAFHDLHGEAVMQQLAVHLDGSPYEVRSSTSFYGQGQGQADYSVVNRLLLPCVEPLKILMKKLGKAYAYARYVDYLERADSLQKALAQPAAMPREFEDNEVKVDAAYESLAAIEQLRLAQTDGLNSI